MRSRREQIRAYRFVTRRIVAALLGSDPETSDQPLRRGALTTFASVMVGALVLAGVGIYGLVRPGGDTSWKQPGALIVEQDTGTRYVYSGGRLHPVLNYVSARLWLRRAQVTVVTVSTNSLADVPRGRPVGIPGAPDTLPDAGRLTGLPWSVCATRDPAGVAHDPMVTVLVGTRAAGATALTDDGLLVTAGEAGIALVWHGHRLRIPDRTALASLGWTNHPVLTVAPAFLNALPAGPDLVAPKVDGAGRDGPKVAGHTGTVGDVYQVTAPTGGGSGYLVLLPDGLAPISAVTAGLLLGHGSRSTPQRLSPTDYQAAQASPRTVDPVGAPTRRPRLADVADEVGPAVCAVYRGGRDATHPTTAVALYRQAPRRLTDRDPAGSPESTGDLGALRATTVVVPGGGGALVRAAAVPGVPTTSLFLVTDQGVRYPMPDDKALTALGYRDVTPVQIPADLLELLPAGPVLDQAAAGRSAPDRQPASGSPSPVPSGGGD